MLEGERNSKDKYFQVFENPDGKSDSRRVRLELDRFHRPIEISFESSRLKNSGNFKLNAFIILNI